MTHNSILAMVFAFVAGLFTSLFYHRAIKRDPPLDSQLRFLERFAAGEASEEEFDEFVLNTRRDRASRALRLRCQTIPELYPWNLATSRQLAAAAIRDIVEEFREFERREKARGSDTLRD